MNEPNPLERAHNLIHAYAKAFRGCSDNAVYVALLGGLCDDIDEIIYSEYERGLNTGSHRGFKAGAASTYKILDILADYEADQELQSGELCCGEE